MPYDDEEKLTYVPAPTALDWIAVAIALVLCVAALVSLDGGAA